jgi:enoyl-CoA hydratase/carnithine racemase
MEMPLFGRWVSAAPGTFFVLPEIAMGLVPGAGGTVSVPWRAGRWRAAWMAVTGARIDTTTALDWGLIDAVEPATLPAETQRTSRGVPAREVQ